MIVLKTQKTKTKTINNIFFPLTELFHSGVDLCHSSFNANATALCIINAKYKH